MSRVSMRIIYLFIRVMRLLCLEKCCFQFQFFTWWLFMYSPFYLENTYNKKFNLKWHIKGFQRFNFSSQSFQDLYVNGFRFFCNIIKSNFPNYIMKFDVSYVKPRIIQAFTFDCLKYVTHNILQNKLDTY